MFSLGLSESLATKCVSLNDESCMGRSTLIDLNLIELKYYPFMMSLDECIGSYNLEKYVFRKKQKT